MTTDKDLTLKPLKGKSGQAYIGEYPNGERVFVKLNTAPILATLSKEQITPPLLWAKRTASGDMMSAQEWLDGRLLTKADMNSKQIVQILLQLHKSKALVNQLIQFNYAIENPFELLESWNNNAPLQLRENTYLQSVISDLKRHLPDFDPERATIVHGDVCHSNWIVTTSGMVYLVDWDTVRLTDRMYDVAHILSHYIPKSRWDEWLSYYGYKINDLVKSKLYWYGQLSFLMQILAFYELRDMEHVNREIYNLRQFKSSF